MTTTVVNPIEAFKKDPNAKLDYTFDWSDWMPTGDTITASAFTIETISGDASPLISSSSPAESFSASSSTTTLWLEDGTAGNTYVVTNQITTSDGRISENSIVIIIEDK